MRCGEGDEKEEAQAEGEAEVEGEAEAEAVFKMIERSGTANWICISKPPFPVTVANSSANCRTSCVDRRCVKSAKPIVNLR